MNHLTTRGCRLLPRPMLMVLLLLCLAMPAGAGEVTRLEMEGIDGGRAILNLASAPLKTMTSTPFHLMLTNASGAPITGSTIRCDLTMPAMPMPENRPQIAEQDGVYWGEAVFTMAGAWQATFAVMMPDGRLELLVFDIGEVLLK